MSKKVEDGPNYFGLFRTSELYAYQTWNCNVTFPKSESKRLSKRGIQFKDQRSPWVFEKKVTFKGTVFIVNFNGRRAYPIIGLGATYTNDLIELGELSQP